MTKTQMIASAVGAGIRFVLYLTGFEQIFERRVEVSTPSNSWMARQEALYIWLHDMNPYEGDTYHQTPLEFYFNYALINVAKSGLVKILVFNLIDICTAKLLGAAAEQFKKYYMKDTESTAKHTETESGDSLLVNENDYYGDWVFLAYYLNPFIIANCLAKTSTVYSNLFIALAIFGMGSNKLHTTRLGLAMSIYLSLYPVLLLFPAFVFIHERAENDGGQRRIMKTIQDVCVRTLSLLIVLYVVSSRYWNIPDVLDMTFGFMLNVRDLKPNIGLFWYFFTEMFEHFHQLFIWTFQINAFIYAIPLTIRFNNHPPIILYSVLTLMTIFKPYPCVGDVGLYLAFLPAWRHIFPFMQQKFLVGCFFIATTVLAPIQWYLWIYSGSANANFYFGVTIAFGTAQIFLLTDILLAYLKREYFLEHGVKKEVNGKPVGLSLI